MPTTLQPTKSGAKKLSEVARHLVVPTGIVSTGWPAVRKTCTEKLGITFDPWQEGAGRVILAKRADGNLAAMIDGVGMSLPRQVGKTYLIGSMVFALCVNTPGLLVIWSAHHARTHGETFLAMQGFTKRAKVAAHVRQVFTGSGDEEIRFHNGSRILFGARERGFGRGIPGVDILIFDEAQILSDRALSNMLATMNTSRFGLALYIGTPPRPEDMSESFRRMRGEALAKTLVDGAWIEFGADLDADPGDRKQWAKGNPSYPLRTPAQSIMRLKKKLTLDDFRREGMGIWDDEAAVDTAIDLVAWSRLENARAKSPTRAVLAIDVAPDRRHSTIAVAGQGSEGDKTLVIVRHSTGTSWVVPEVVKLVEKRDIAEVVLHPGSQAGALVTGLAAAGIAFTALTTTELGQACAQFQEDVAHKRLEHVGQPAFDAAIANGRTRRMGEAERWDRREPGIDISPLVAASEAAFAWAKYAGSDYELLDSIY
jgi:phage terminase large subunit-like protein